MLQHLLIRNVAIANNIEVEWSSGMTSISGETGAGKSILLNSLALALGGRAESAMVRHGESRAEVVATFNVDRIDRAKGWLQSKELDNGSECILRRTISADGRSRGYINGQPVPLAELKEVGEYLIDIHSQHAHQSLLNSDHQLQLLDDFCGNSEKRREVKERWIAWQGLLRKFQSKSKYTEDKINRIQLLEYQCAELEELNIAVGEVEAMEQQFKRLQKSDTLIATTNRTIEELSNENEVSSAGLIDGLKQSLNRMQSLEDDNEALHSAVQLMEGAVIQLEESLGDLTSYSSSFDIDDQARFDLEARLNAVHELARKHRVQSEDLYLLTGQLGEELSQLKQDNESLESMESELKVREQAYFNSAQQLAEARRRGAESFKAEIMAKLNQLAMNGAEFDVQFQDRAEPSVQGTEQLQFLISLNPGQPLKPMTKVASGGELSRISLAIQVLCAEHSTIPTLVFDEVDVGVSGATAEIVGHMLRSVGTWGQVLCVTHLPQVAALGHNHMVVSKTHSDNLTTTAISPIDQSERVDEIARMLGGIDITAQTRAHAEEMLRSQTQAH